MILVWVKAMLFNWIRGEAQHPQFFGLESPLTLFSNLQPEVDTKLVTFIQIAIKLNCEVIKISFFKFQSFVDVTVVIESTVTETIITIMLYY